MFYKINQSGQIRKFIILKIVIHYNKKKILDDEKLFKDYKIQLLDVVANDYLLIEEYGKKLDELFKYIMSIHPPKHH